MKSLQDFIDKITRNWKTSATGITGMILGISHIIHSLKTGAPVNLEVDLGAIIFGLGLLAAKDSNVSGGTKSDVPGQPPSIPMPEPLKPLPSNATDPKKE